MHATKLKGLVPFALGLSVVAAIAFTPTSSSAAPAGNIASAIPSQNEMLQQARYRGHGHYRGYRDRGYRGGYYRRDRGGAVAAGVIGGLALGAILGAASAPPPPPVAYYEPDYAGDDWLAYCSSKYRSFDPRSGTYLGYDGLRHPCQ